MGAQSSEESDTTQKQRESQCKHILTYGKLPKLKVYETASKKQYTSGGEKYYKQQILKIKMWKV